MTYATIKPVEIGLSSLIGLGATLALLFLIELLSAIHPATEDLNQAIVIDLTEWQTPADPQIAQPEKKSRPPEPKIIPRPIKHEIVDKTLNEQPPEPVQEPDTIARPNTQTKADPDDNALPVPVPLFKLTETPRFLHQENPEYPESMRTLGKTGHVTLSVLIDKSGRVRDIAVLESDSDAFTQAAIKAIMASSFIPAKIDGNPVAVKLKLPVSFKLL